MSRVAKAPIVIPDGVEIKINSQIIGVKGEKGQCSYSMHKAVEVVYSDSVLTFNLRKEFPNCWKQAGTARALVNSMVRGVSKGFTKKLHLVGVGYRAAVKNSMISLSLGYSHPVSYQLPTGITAECPSQTEIVLKSADKQLIGQVAADLQAFRRPEPYKGSGIRYAGEVIRTKEAKKK